MGKVTPETFGPGVYAFPMHWKVKKKWVDNFKGNDRVPLVYTNEKQRKHQTFVRQSVTFISSIAFYEICLVLKLLSSRAVQVLSVVKKCWKGMQDSFYSSASSTIQLQCQQLLSPGM